MSASANRGDQPFDAAQIVPFDRAGVRPARAGVLAAGIVHGTLNAVIVNASHFVSNWAVVRWYGAGFHGDLAWLVSASGLAMLCSDLGLAGKAGARTIARLRAVPGSPLDSTVSALVTIPLAIAGALGAAMFALAGPVAAGRPGVEPLAVRLAASWTVLMAGVRACQVLFIGYERMASVLLTASTAELGRVAWVFACAGLGLPAWAIFAGWAGAWTVALAVGLARARGLAAGEGLRLRPRVGRPAEALRMIAQGLPYHIPQVGMLGLPFIMQLLLSALHEPGPQASCAISVFQVCFSLSLISRMLAVPISTALLPRMALLEASGEGGGGHGRMAAALDKVVRLLGVAGTLALTFMWLVGEPLLGRLYGPLYAAALPALLVLTFAIAIDNYAMQLDQVLMAKGRAGVVAWLEALRYAVLAGVSAAAVRPYGVAGAAAAVTAASIANLAAKMLAARGTAPSLGLAGLTGTVATFAAVAAVGLTGWRIWLLAPAWLVAGLATRLVRPRELASWAAASLGMLRAAR